MVLAGWASDNWAATNVGELDFLAVMLGTDTVGTPAPTNPTLPHTVTTTPAPTVTWSPAPAPNPPGTTHSPVSTPIIAGVASATAAVGVIAAVACLWRRRKEKLRTAEHLHSPPATKGLEKCNQVQEPQSDPHPDPDPVTRDMPPPPPPHQHRHVPPPPLPTPAASSEVAAGSQRAPASFLSSAGGVTSRGASCLLDGGDRAAEPDSAVTAFTTVASTEENTDPPPFAAEIDVMGAANHSGRFRGGDAHNRSHAGTSAGTSRAASNRMGVSEAVLEAAQDLAQRSQILGVSEAATLVSILVKLVTDKRGNIAGVEWRVKRCRSIIIILQRAEKLLGKVSQRTPCFARYCGPPLLLTCGGGVPQRRVCRDRL